LAGIDGTWTLTELSAFLKKPADYAPGTKMSFAGLKDDEDRVNLIVWLNEVDGSPIDLAAGLPDLSDAGDTASEEAETTETAATDATTETSSDEASNADTASDEGASDTTSTDEGSSDAATSDEATTVASETETETTEVAAADTSGGDATGGAFPAGDAAAGEKVYRRCKACHKMEDGKNGVGPHLHGVIGRMIAGVDGYAYSGALSGMQGVWTGEILAAFLESPRKWAPGNKMGFAGLRKEKDRIDVIVYLNEADGSPDPLN